MTKDVALVVLSSSSASYLLGRKIVHEELYLLALVRVAARAWRKESDLGYPGSYEADTCAGKAGAPARAAEGSARVTGHQGSRQGLQLEKGGEGSRVDKIR